MTAEIIGDIDTLPAIDAQEFTLSDVATVAMVNVLPRRVTFPKAFIVDADGTLSIENLNGDDVKIPVLKGVIYPISAVKYRSTDSVNVTLVIGLG